MQQPRYQQIAQQLREDMLAGKYPENAQIPPENELASLMGVSRPTVRQALNLLEQEGRLIRIKGSGTFVSEPKLVHESTHFLIGYQEESREKNRILHTRVLTLQQERARPVVAQMLGLATGEMVTRLTRVRWLENMYGNAPVVYTTVYVPVRVFPQMVQTNFTDASFYDLLQAHGLRVERSTQRLEIRIPPAEIAAGLKLSPFEPTAYICSRGYGTGGKVIEYSESDYPASRSSFHIEIQR